MTEDEGTTTHYVVGSSHTSFSTVCPRCGGVLAGERDGKTAPVVAVPPRCFTPIRCKSEARRRYL